MAFSEVVSSPAWRAEAEDWVRAQVAESGGRVVGDITQPRVRPWSTQLVVPTDAGRLWFKANCRRWRSSRRSTGRWPGSTPGRSTSPSPSTSTGAGSSPVTAGPRSGTLTRRRSTTGGRSSPWPPVCSAASPPRDRSCWPPGCRTRSPHTVPARYAEQIDALAALPRGHPSHLDVSTVGRLRSASGLVDDAVATILASPLPTASLQHGDLHPGNVFAVEGRLRVFDFGDAQWAHPLETLAVPWGWVHQRTSLPWPAIVDAYASGWADVLDPAAFERLLAAAMVTQPVNRCSTWSAALGRRDARGARRMG